jgi:dihydroxyacetone kinase-like predicted kinase
MAVRVASELAHMSEARLGPDASTEEQDALIADIIERALEAGRESVRRGPDLLPVLREAGVVDAGGHAITVLLAGIIGALRGSEPPAVEHQAAARVTHPDHSSTTFRYCTNFAVTGNGLDPTQYARALESLGDSVLVVGDQTTLKVHVHTDDPDAATALFERAGVVSHLDVADMREQVRARDHRLTAVEGARSGALAVTTGMGMRRLFESLGVRALDVGPKVNPSTYELLAAIHAIPAEEVVVLPNNANVIMAAERAAALADRAVRVVPSRSPQAGLAAAVSFDPTRAVEENATAMHQAIERVRTGAVAPAARDDARGRFHQGDALGFVDDEMVVWGDAREALQEVLERLGRGAELITLLRGVDAPLDDDAVSALSHDGVELELSEGGQPNYWWLLSAE